MLLSGYYRVVYLAKPKSHKIRKKSKKSENDSNVIMIKKSTMKNAALVAVVVFIVAIAAIMLSNRDVPAPVNGDSGDKVPVDFYVMSQCPYGTQVEDAMKPVLDKMGENVDFNLHFIMSSPERYQGQEDTYCVEDLCSMHGISEVKGNIVQLCAAEHNPEKFMDMIVCMNENANQIPDNWEQCAEEAGLDVEKVRECYEGEEGMQLLRESAERAREVGATGSPTIYFNEEPYSGGRDEISFQRAVCAYLDEEPECEGIPVCAQDTDCPAKDNMIPVCENPGTEDAECTYVEPEPVELIVLNDDECSSCDTSRILTVSNQLFPGLTQENIDVDSEQGKALVDELGITYVPAYLFESNVENTKSWQDNAQLKGSFEETGDYWKLKDSVTGASYFVSDDKRQEHLAERGIETGDNMPQIDFFIMSYCPYGNQAEEGIEPVYQLLQDKAQFNPRYVIYENYRGGGDDYCLGDGSYCSMHGVQELNQNIRELCVYEKMGTAEFFEFALAMNDECTYQNADTCWEAVAEDLGLDTEVISQCEEQEGLEIAEEQLELTQQFGVSGSPTVFIDGVKHSSGREPENYKDALCEAYEDAPSECETELASSGEAPATGQC